MKHFHLLVFQFLFFVAIATTSWAQQASKSDVDLSLDAVRLGLWSRFGTVESFAGRLKMPQSELEQFLLKHQWDLPTAPAARLTNADLSGRKVSLSSSSEEMFGIFVNQKGVTDSITQSVVFCDEKEITVVFRCEELKLDKLVTSYLQKDPLPEAERWFRDGDLVALKKKAGFP